MKSLDRVLLIVQSLGMAAVAAVVLLMSFGWTIPLDYLRTSLADTYGRLLFAVVSGVLLLTSIRLFLSGSGHTGGKQTVVHETALGQIRISLHAVENLVKKVARQVKGVRDVKALITASEANEISVQLRVVVSPEVSIPAVSGEIQQTVKEYIHDVVGVTVTLVKVYVENISADVRARVD